MAQWIKVLALQALGPDLSSNPQNPHKARCEAHFCNPSAPKTRWEVEIESLGTHWSASLVYTRGKHQGDGISNMHSWIHERTHKHTD